MDVPAPYQFGTTIRCDFPVKISDVPLRYCNKKKIEFTPELAQLIFYANLIEGDKPGELIPVRLGVFVRVMDINDIFYKDTKVTNISDWEYVLFDEERKKLISFIRKAVGRNAIQLIADAFIAYCKNLEYVKHTIKNHN